MDGFSRFASLVICVLVAVLTQVIYGNAAANLHASNEYCEWQKFVAKCPNKQVIIMREAKYGRMKDSRCIKRNYGYIGCSSDVLPISDVRCSGRHRCEISIPDQQFSELTTDCPDDLKRYFIGSYDCVPVITPEFPGVCYDGRTVKVRQTAATVATSSGYLASIVTSETQCGDHNNPWLLDAAPGQRFKFTLYNFGVFIGRRSGFTTGRHCRVYVSIKDIGDGKSVTVCAETKRVRTVHISTSHIVEVRMMTGNANSTGYFLLHYEVFGCPDLVAPSGGELKRNGNVVTVTCPNHDAWRLHCRNNTWHSRTIRNCSELSSAEGRSSHTTVKTTAIIVILLVALGVGGGIFLCGILFMCRTSAPEQTAEGSVVFGPRHSHSDPYKGDPHFSPYCKPMASPGDNEYETVDECTVGAAPSRELAEQLKADYAVTQFLFSQNEPRSFGIEPTAEAVVRCPQYYELEDADKTTGYVAKRGSFDPNPIVQRKV